MRCHAACRMASLVAVRWRKSTLQLGKRAVGSAPHPFAQLGLDRTGVAVVAVGRDPVRRAARNGFGGAEERAGRLCPDVR